MNQVQNSDDPAELLKNFPVQVEIPVQWGDQDAFGHVNNTVYFRWFETARIAYLERAGMSHAMQDERVCPIVASIQCSYRRQVVYPDRVLVGGRVASIGRSSFKMEHRVVSLEPGKLAAEGEAACVMFDYRAQRPVRVPAEYRATFEKLEGLIASQ